MAKSDALTPWRQFYAEFNIRGDQTRRLHPPTPEQLRQFESETGVRLPAGYRGFIQVFGPGSLDLDTNLFRMRAPYCATPYLDLGESLKASLRLTPEWLYPAQVRRLVYFANNFSGDQFGWDPEEVTDSASPEFAIYGWLRGDEEATKLANSFQAFLQLCLDRSAYSKALRLTADDEEEDEDDAEDRPFNPSGRMPKKDFFLALHEQQ